MLYDYLCEFSVIAQEGALSVAAGKLNISQPSLSRHISALETELGAQLLKRGSFGVQLTDEGRTALVTALDIAALEQSVIDHFSDRQRRVQERHVLVGLLGDCRMVSRMLSSGCSQLNAEGYRIELRSLRPNTLNSVVTSLAQRDVDILIGFQAEAEAAQDAGGFSVSHLMNATTVIILSPKHPLAQTGVFTVADLKGLRFVRNPGEHKLNSAAWSEFCRCCKEEGFSPSFRMSYAINPLGSEVRSYDDVAFALAGSAEMDRYCAAGSVAIPVSNWQMKLYAVARSDDELANCLIKRALEIDYEDEEFVRAISHQEMYGSVAQNETELAPLSFEGQGRLYEQLINEPKVSDDMVLPDGRVVDKAYVALRNRLNRIGDGLSNNPVASSYDAIMALWTVEEAQAELEMPFMKWFTAYDFAASSGRDINECIDILDRLSHRNLIYRVSRGGVNYFCLLGWVHGIWEFSVQRYDKEFLSWGIYGSDAGTRSQFPIMHVCPVSRTVIKDGDIVPYRDWEAHIGYQTKACIAPCQCRHSHDIIGTRTCKDEDHPMRVCLTFGEMAEFFIENGNGEEISVDESLAIARNAVFDHGLVPQLCFGKNPEIMCFCHVDCCYVLASIKAIQGSSELKRNSSAYRMEYDSGSCIGCGVCATRCPMTVISLNDEKRCQNEDACVGCGQCALQCPVGARSLVAKAPEEICALFDDWVEGYRGRSLDRMARGYITDFTGNRLSAWTGKRA